MSQALSLFRLQMQRAYTLTQPSILNGKTNAQRQVFYHAEIAARVAAWDAYLNQIVPEALTRVGDPLNPEIIALKAVASAHASQHLQRFNTPNFENSRNLLIRCVGFDPIASWSWPLRAMNWQLVNTRLNEILTVRHSFAHGFPIPRYPWLPSRGLDVYFNRNTVEEIARLLRYLANRTDVDLDTYLRQSYQHLNPPKW